MSGELIIKQLQADLIAFNNEYRNITPYLKIKLGKKTITTAASTSGSYTPSWETKVLFRRNKEKEIRVEVYHMNKLFFNTLLGTVVIPFSLVYTQQYLYREHKAWFPLEKKGKVNGRVHLELVFYPDVIYPMVKTPAAQSNQISNQVATMKNVSYHSSLTNLGEIEIDISKDSATMSEVKSAGTV